MDSACQNGSTGTHYAGLHSCTVHQQNHLLLSFAVCSVVGCILLRLGLPAGHRARMGLQARQTAALAPAPHAGRRTALLAAQQIHHALFSDGLCHGRSNQGILCPSSCHQVPWHLDERTHA